MDMLRILVADEDPAVCQTLSRYLGDMGHKVQTEGSPYLLDARMKSFRPDLTFVDLTLADRSGLDIFSGIYERAYPYPLVFISDQRKPEQMRRVRVMDILSVISKPFDYDQIDRLINMIERRLRVRAAVAA